MVLLLAAACTPADPVTDDGPRVPTTPVPQPQPQPQPTEPDTTSDFGALVFEGERPTHLLTIILDTARRDYIGSGLTPNLDRILGQGVLLEDHRSCSNWTGPSMACLVTGATPIQYGFWPGALDNEIVTRAPASYAPDTLAGRLTARGYETALVTANEIFSSRYFGIGEGFSRETVLEYEAADVLAAAALEEARALRDGGAPHYLHVHFMDPHAPYCPPAGYADTEGIPNVIPPQVWCVDSYAPNAGFEASPADAKVYLLEMMTALYAGEIRYWDSIFGEWWADLEAEGLLDDTLVVFATDHGQQFFERGGHGHALALGPEENDAAAGFWAKNLRPAAWTGPTTHQDVGVSLFEVFGITPTGPVSGVRIGDAPTSRVTRGMNYLNLPVQMSIVSGNTQLVYDWGGERAFYDLATDPAALTDVYDPLDPRVIAAWAELDLFIDEVQPVWSHLAPVNRGP